MSRKIMQTSGKTDSAHLKGTEGKVLVTVHNDKYLTLLIRGNRLIAVNASDENGDRIGSVYIGKVKNIVKNIDSCFVEIADGELVFLPLSECRSPFLINRQFQGKLAEGDELLVQIVRDAMKTKQAAATADISMTGGLLVFTLGSCHTGISAKIPDLRKKEIRELLFSNGITDESGNLLPVDDLPPFGIVVRTQMQHVSDEDFLKEYRTRLDQFTSMLKAARHRTCFTCVHAAPKTYISSISRFYQDEYTEIVTDLPEIAKELRQLAASNQLQVPVRLYEDTSYPLMKLYGIISKLEDAVEPCVWLKSGGYLIIEHTEALTAIDVNTGKYEGKRNVPDTFLKINLEAAEEIALQLRLRNLSGIIIIDFISMNSKEHQEKLMKYLTDLVRRDPTRTSVIDMTPLGLVEITRKKEWKTLKEQLGRSGI